MDRRRFRIKTAFSGGLLLVVILLWPPLYLYVYKVSSESIVNHYLDMVRGTTSQYASFISLSSPETPEQLTQILDEFMLRNNVVYARLNIGGTQYDSNLGESEQTLFKEDIELGEHSDETYFLSAPVTTALGSGFLYAGFDESLIQTQLFKLKQYILGMLLAFCFLWVLIILAVSRPMGRAIREMTVAANQIAEGADQVVKHDYVLEEFSELGQSLDEMRTQLKERTQVLSHAANHDALSGVANRLSFNSVLNTTLAESAVNSNVFVVLLDIDNFKKINDSYGHNVGDRLITYMAKMLQHKFRQSALIARIGGDEFALIVRDRSIDTVKLRINQLFSIHHKKIHMLGYAFRLKFSVGIVELSLESGLTADEYMHRADVAMYASKIEGNRLTVYNGETLRQHERALQLISDLQHLDASEDHGIHLVYQPKYRLDDGSLIGVEALCRWNNHRLGAIEPLEFIKLAEQHGAITKLTSIVLDQALAQQVQWRKEGIDVRVAINISPADIREPRFVEHLTNKLRQHQIHPRQLELEITEHDFIDPTEIFKSQLTALSAMGVRLSIDDFGSGYANLNALRHYPFSSIKIDKQFVNHLSSNDRDRIIVKTVLALAHELNIDVIAEGIETESELKLLVELGCNFGQGYHFSRPLPPESISSVWHDVRKVPQVLHT